MVHSGVFIGSPAFSVPPKRSSLPPVNYGSLFQTFADLFQLALQAEDWPADLQPKLVESYPAEREGAFDNRFDVILPAVESACIASTSNTTDRRPKGIQLAASEPYPGLTGYLQNRYKWQEECTIRFDILSKSNRGANQLSWWWHQTLLTYAHSEKFFLARGISDFRFSERQADATSKEYGQTLYKRPLLYSMRLELDFVSKIKTLDQIRLHGPDGVRVIEHDG